ncbi:MAG TPA: helix-turn-helix transcriptional regulator [Mariprofundaceae bacterium]|nr:helix-turn-helix transcriptional regulator [Mariprofundaceae bacterium]
MIKCHLSRMMGERKVKAIEVARETGLHRNTVGALYFERASRVDLDAIDALCRYFECSVADLFEYVPDGQGE